MHDDDAAPSPGNQTELYDELASRLAQPDGQRLVRLLQMVGLLGPGAAVEAPPPPRDEDGPRPISIWEPSASEDPARFVRAAPGPLGDHFAARASISAAPPAGVRRVCFFGESAAAGYLYAPHYTPAGVLQAQLDTRYGHDQIEVIDLARTDERLDGLLDKIDASAQLSPELLVIMVGNNWTLLETPEVSPYLPSVASRQRFGVALREAGLRGPLELARRAIEARVVGAMAELDRRARGMGAQVVFVVPEINLADWEQRQPVPWLDGDETQRWHDLHGIAGQALDQGHAAAARAAAEEMTELDMGTSPTPHRLLGRAALCEGEPARAHAHFCDEVDAVSYALMGPLAAPQCNTAGRELLLGAAARHEFACVDLREVLQRAEAGIPGDKWMLDYCHLTAAGIQHSMHAVACALGDGLGLEPVTEVTGQDGPLTFGPTPEVEALACVGAAVHTAHRLICTDKPSRLALWCERAVDAHPSAIELMMDFLSLRTQPGAAALDPAMLRNLERDVRLQFQHGIRWTSCDADLVIAILDVLQRRAEPQVLEHARALVARRALSSTPTELVGDGWHLWDPIQRLHPDAMPFDDLQERAHLRSPWPTTSLALILEAPSRIHLEIVARLRPTPTFADHRGRATVHIEGTEIGTFELTGCWSKHEIEVPQDVTSGGLNRLVIGWPALPPIGEQAIGEAIARLENGVEADVFPIFGELFRARARTLG